MEMQNVVKWTIRSTREFEASRIEMEMQNVECGSTVAVLVAMCCSLRIHAKWLFSLDKMGKRHHELDVYRRNL